MMVGGVKQARQHGQCSGYKMHGTLRKGIKVCERTTPLGRPRAFETSLAQCCFDKANKKRKFFANPTRGRVRKVF
jgi:hypothetical protein